MCSSSAAPTNASCSRENLMQNGHLIVCDSPNWATYKHFQRDAVRFKHIQKRKVPHSLICTSIAPKTLLFLGTLHFLRGPKLGLESIHVIFGNYIRFLQLKLCIADARLFVNSGLNWLGRLPVVLRIQMFGGGGGLEYLS